MIVAEFALLNTLVFAPFLLVGAQVADESLGDPGAWATILIAMGIGEIAGGIVAKTWQPSRPLVAGTTALIAWIVPLLLLADLAPVGLIARGAALAGGAHSLFGTLWETTLQSHIPHDSRSRVASYDQLGSLACLPVGYIIAGVVQAELGTSPTLMVGRRTRFGRDSCSRGSAERPPLEACPRIDRTIPLETHYRNFPVMSLIRRQDSGQRRTSWLTTASGRCSSRGRPSASAAC